MASKPKQFNDDTRALVDQYLAEGGKVTKLPYYSPSHKKMGRLLPSPDVKPLNPKQEARNLEKQAYAHEQKMEEYRRAKCTGKPIEKPTPPWDE